MLRNMTEVEAIGIPGREGQRGIVTGNVSGTSGIEAYVVRFSDGATRVAFGREVQAIHA